MKIPTPFVSLCAIATLSLTVTGCLFGDSNDGASEPGTPPGTAQYPGKYFLQDGKLVFPPQERIKYECDQDDVLQTIRNTTMESSSFFDIRGDTLYLGLYLPENLSSGAVVQMLDVYKRKGSGSGLKGQWTYVDRTFRIQASNLTAQEEAQYESMAAGRDREYAFAEITLVIGDSLITSYSDIKRAELFLAAWNGLFEDFASDADSAEYSVSLKVVDKQTVELKGSVTEESVRIVISNEGSRRYSSSLPGHATHHFEVPPETCPNSLAPDWFREFLDANRKP